MTAALATRASLAEIEAFRNQAFDQYGQAHDMIMAANDMLRAAGETLRKAAPAADGMFMTQDQRKAVFGSYEVAKRDQFMTIARQMVDADCWTSIVKTTDLERLMDKKAKDELRAELRASPPPFTEETAASTLEKFASEAGMIFRRGIAEVFSNLDRRFRSHTGWKIGARIILSSAFDGTIGNGHWNYHRNHRDKFQDIERTFLILDGRKGVSQYAGIVGEIDAARGRGELKTLPVVIEGEFFRIRIFQNGNAHLWFKRDDLVTIANRMIGEYYGEVIPEERKHDNDDGGLHEPKRSLAKNFGFFPTPDTLADRTVDDARLYSPGRPLRVLEPSAGTGQLARRARKADANVVCVEYQRDLAMQLRADGFNTYAADFLDIKPEAAGSFDRVIMNPPFDRERDIDHVMHALKFLRPDGFLIAIMSAHTEFAETRKAKAFRDLMGKMNARWSDNPRNSFSTVGTNVNTITLRVYADGRSFW
ncbi:DUF4942 domain-containing protein [Mesorhizobium sp. Cs1299R1N3]|uniref:DUF4942 domain-containing protein n=1 Tax=Mesorhizobium sp. Cs1299R1N3 TaxID=3015173 RepID=UPI00301D22C6